MNLIQGYESSGNENENNPEKELKNKFALTEFKINSAPDADITQLEIKKQEDYSKKLEKLYKKEEKNHLTGQADSHYMSDFNFDEQYHNFQKYGFAYDPSTQKTRVVFNEKIHPELSKKVKKGINVTISESGFEAKSVFGLSNKEEFNKKKDMKKGRNQESDPSSANFLGPWASYKNEDLYVDIVELTEDQKETLKKLEEKRKKKIEDKKEMQAFEIKSVFHGKDLFDYKGRSYILPPSDLKESEHTCYIPKKVIHNFSGHTKGVQVVRFFPKYGHYLLSGSLDSKIKLWDLHGDKKCIRTYMGHQEAVRDLYFTNDGFNFLSAGFDKMIHYWDTETGKVIKSFHLKKWPYCVRFNPERDKQHSFLVGSANKKIGQYDIRTGNRTQQYDEHLGAVNTVTFIDNNRKFVSTSDDKKIFMWEFGIPVVVKHISEPEMHSITQTSMHPNNKYFAGQSSDNKVAIYDSKAGNFRLNRKKKFQGHLSAGYAISLGFSPDGQYLASGDADGKVWFWDWKSTKNLRTMQAHDGVCIGVAWHPLEPSKFVSCGWDGLIKYWD